MTGRELLEFAAKAAGYTELRPANETWTYFVNTPEGRIRWDPLTDDGDAFGLAVKLMESGQIDTDFALLRLNHGDKHDDADPYAATRRAIVRAAAEIGKAMP